MLTLSERLSAVRNLLKERQFPRQDSTTDQIKDLLIIGNLLGLYDAVDCVKNRIPSR